MYTMYILREITNYLSILVKVLWDTIYWGFVALPQKLQSQNLTKKWERSCFNRLKTIDKNYGA